ncbi:MAG: M28 family peptidase [Pseudomonadota bacterium]
MRLRLTSIEQFAGILFGLTLVCFAGAQTPADEELKPTAIGDERLARLREAQERAPDAHNLVYELSDRFGARAVGTPHYLASLEWAEQILRAAGVEDFDRPRFLEDINGWASGEIHMGLVAPNLSPLAVRALPYSPSTDGTLDGHASVFQTSKELREALSSQPESLSGAFVFLDFAPHGGPADPVNIRTFSQETLQAAAANTDTNRRLIGYHARVSVPSTLKRWDENRERVRPLLESLHDAGVAAIVQKSTYGDGIIDVDANNLLPVYPNREPEESIPGIVMDRYDFQRVVRLVDGGQAPKLRLYLRSTFYDLPESSVSLIATIPGEDSQLKHQVVMAGAHLDGWPAGSSASDNAAGVATLLAAMALLKEAEAKPRRTIKIALWGGHEGAFAGSLGYLEREVRTIAGEIRSPLFHDISVYLNIDNGAGRIRGVYLSGRNDLRTTFEQILTEPQTSTVTIQAANQTDHELFDHVGIPAFQFIQDPLDTMARTHHTTLDRPEFVPAGATRANAVTVASALWRLADLDDPLPRRRNSGPLPTLAGETPIVLPGFDEAEEVSVTGDFNSWHMFATRMARRPEGGWLACLSLPPGDYLYKFIIDGRWTNHPATPEAELLEDGDGHRGLTRVTVPYEAEAEKPLCPAGPNSVAQR